MFKLSLAQANAIYMAKAQAKAEQENKQALRALTPAELIAQVNAEQQAKSLEDEAVVVARAKLAQGTISQEHRPSRVDLALHFGSYNKWRRLASLAIGMCGVCHVNPTREGRTLCRECNNQQLARTKKQRYGIGRG